MAKIILIIIALLQQCLLENSFFFFVSLIRSDFLVLLSSSCIDVCGLYNAYSGWWVTMILKIFWNAQ